MTVYLEFPPKGFLRFERNEARIRSFLIERLHLPVDTVDVRTASHETYSRLPDAERDSFQGEWWDLLMSLEK